MAERMEPTGLREVCIMLERGPFTLLGVFIAGTIGGCSQGLATSPARPARDLPPAIHEVKAPGSVSPQGGEVVVPGPTRYLPFVVCGGEEGGLALWDEVVQDVFFLDGALVGVAPVDGKHVGAPARCEDLLELSPVMVNDQRVMFGFRGKVYVWDMIQEVRLTAATDARPTRLGGPSATVTSDGRWVAYLNLDGNLVLKETDGAFATKTRELVKIAAEGEVLDFDLSGDGRWIVLSLEGRVYLYDRFHPQLFQGLPLSGEDLAGGPNGVGAVAISETGRFVAAVIPGCRLLVYDCRTGRLDTIPYLNLAVQAEPRLILTLGFTADEAHLVLESWDGSTYRLWDYGIANELLRGFVVPGAALGSRGVDSLVSRRDL